MELEPQENLKREVPLKLNLGFALGEIPDAVAYQGFSFLIFTFYSVTLHLDVDTVTIVFVIWSIFNAFNDPILGAFSDKTKTTKLGGGRRRPWIVAMLIPLPLVMVFLFTPPTSNKIMTAIYMGFIMVLFDTLYTTYSLNHTSLYPEMFPTDRAREEVGTSRRIMMVVGLLVAFALPGFIIPDMTLTDEFTRGRYILCGGIFGGIIFIFILWHLLTGIREPSVEEIKRRDAFSLGDSLKYTLKDRNFIVFVFSSTMNWYVFGLIPMVLPVYCKVQFGLDRNSFDTSLLLVIAFLSSVPGAFWWSWVDKKVGSRLGFIFCMGFWAISLVPLYFLQNYAAVAVVMVFIGFGFGGSPYYIDRNISNIADQDELRHHKRREASFYGVHAIFIRLATILVIFSVRAIFKNFNGWEEINLSVITPDQQFGLRILMSVFPAIALVIGIIFALIFPLTKRRVSEILEKKQNLRRKTG